MHLPRFRRDMLLALVAGSIAVLAVGGLLALLASATLESSTAWGELTEGAYLRLLAYSLGQAIAATAAGLLLGLPASYLLARAGLPLRSGVAFLLVAPLAIPGVVTALGLEALAGGDLGGRTLVILAHGIIATAAVVWLVTPAWANGNARAIEDARTLGADPVRAYLASIGGGLVPAVAVAAALAFWLAFSGAGTVAVLAPTEGTTESLLAFGDPVEVALAPLSASPSDLTAERSVVALVQVAIGVAVLALGGPRWPHARWTSGLSEHTQRGVLLGGAIYLAILATALWLPVATVVYKAADAGLLDDVASLHLAGQQGGDLLLWTAIIGLLAGTAATAAAVLASRWFGTSARDRRATFGRILLALPAGLSGASLGWAGLVLAEQTGADLNRTYAFVVAAHALIAYPFALRLLGSGHVASEVMVEDAVVLGASGRSARWRWSRRPALLAVCGALLVSGVLSAGEVAAAALLTPPEATPAALGVLRGWATNPAGAYALGTALAVLTVVAFGMSEWLRRAAARVEAG